MRRVSLSPLPRRTSRASSRLATVVVGALLLGASARARADAPTTPPPAAADLAAARALFAAGVADERAGRWGDALIKIRRASAVKLTPGLRFHLALCDERLGHLTTAFEEYNAAQAAAQAENNKEVLELVSEPLQQLKLRMPTMTVNMAKRFMIAGGGAEVRIDGTTLPVASYGTAVPVDVGSHTIQASAPGMLPYAMTLTVVERQAATLDIQFLPFGAPGSGVPAPTATDVGAPAASPTQATLTAVDSGPRSPDHTLAIVATASAIGLVAVGVGAYALAGNEQSTSRVACMGVPAGQPCGNATAVRAWDATALGAWIVGAGVGVVAVVLWTRPAKRDAPQTSLRAGPGRLFLEGTF